jgi:RHS repeat-associated protein
MYANSHSENGGENRDFRISPPQISLPKGGGAVRGIGEKFAANPVTGTSSMTVPIATSPGRSGFGPQLSLSYDSGAGNGPFGFGWSISLPAITRKTDKGLPRYLDAEDSDVFILSGAEDLVPNLVQKTQCEWERERLPERIVNGVKYRVRRYRPRIEGLFARIERWTNTVDATETFWRSISKDNITTWYGRTPDSRISDPANPNRIFSWLICQSHDDKGNVIVYGYKREDPARIFEDAGGSALVKAHERNRTTDSRSAQRYLKRIRYGHRAPYFPVLKDDAPWPEPQDAVAPDGSDSWLFEVVFDYGEHDANEPTPSETGKWPARNDPFSSYRAGFEVRTYRTCQRVLMFHHFPGKMGVGRDCLVRSTDFTYSDEVDPTDVRNPVYTFLRSVTQTGYRRNNVGFDSRSLPPVEFQYTEPIVQHAVEEVDPASLENLPAGLDGSIYRWTDLHGEGIPGILTEQAGVWFYKRNWSPLPEKPNDGGESVKARFAPLETVALKANVALSAGAEFMDLAGDGQPDVVVMEGPTPGLYEHDEAEGWQPFRPFTSRLNRDLRDPNVKFIDLDGDGHADVLITEDEAFVWHASLAEEGFGPARRAAQALDEEKGPRVAFADGTQSIHLADLSGDGLTDILRVRNGEVSYWPNLGHGRFGAKVTMDNSPWFDHPELFDAKRLRLADIDGSGTTDIIYLHREGVRLYFNQSGNGWSQPQVLRVFPRVDDLASIVPTDLLGNGTACLVWSSSLPDDARRPMRYVDLMGGRKPHLLVRTINNLGAETRVDYAPSTKFYLQDKRDGRPWITRLPFPVHVVERVETYDHLSRNRFVTCYAYHHGYFDGEEREFRGFGMVEQWDTEQFTALAPIEGEGWGDGQTTNIDSASHVPPVHTKTWFHTGLYQGRGHVSDYFAGLLNATDEGEYFREPGLTDAEARDLLLPDTILPAGLTADEEREACRALKGSMLRREVYADDADRPDATPEQIRRARTPYTVTEQNFTIRTVQPRRGNRHAVFFTHAREAVSCHYERNPADPRIQHAFTLEVDAFGNVLKGAAIGYGRRQPDPSLPTAEDRDKQTRALLTYTENSVTNTIDEADGYRTPLPCEALTFEMTGYQATGAAGRYRAEDLVEPDPNRLGRLRHKVTDDIAYEANPTANPCRRLIERMRTLYRPNDCGAAQNDPLALLPLCELQSLALPGESYQLAFTPGLIDQVFKRNGQSLLPDPAAVLGGAGADRGGYVDLDGNGHWWLPSGRSFYHPDNVAAPVELAEARAHFFLPRRYRDPFNQDAFVDFDVHDLLMAESRDALGNRVTVDANDYRVLQPRLVSDANRNRTEVAFDTLGMVVGTAVMGKPPPAPVEGDTLTGFIADLTQAQLDAFFSAADPHATAPVLLRDATTRIVYDLDRFRRTREANPNDPTKWQPSCAATLARETHVSTPLPPQGLKIQVSFSYSDGFGREIQKKIQAEPGPLTEGGPTTNPRWVGSGWTIFNNKGKPVRQYEPFFSATHDFEFGATVGVSPVLFYDPAERVIVTLHPNHTYEKLVFDPWQQTTWDVNDTCAPRNQQTGDPRTDPDIGGYVAEYFKTQPAAWQTWHDQRIGGALGPDERKAAERAAAHSDTPAAAHFDTLGRPFLTIARNRVICPGHDLDGSEDSFTTRVELDIEGNQRAVRDERKLPVNHLPTGALEQRILMRYAYDLLGRRIHQFSMEAGARWIVNDVAGKPIRAWDSRGHNFTTKYDALRRPVEQTVRGTTAESDPRALNRDTLVDKIEYGEGLVNAEELNLRTRIHSHFDSAGVTVNSGTNSNTNKPEAYDFKGNLLRSTRRLASDYTAIPDWLLPADPQLDAETFEGSTRYDALNRPIQSIAPHSNLARAGRNIIQPVFNEANLFERVDVWLERAAEPGLLLDPATDAPSPVGVANIDYNAKGQRTLIDYKTRDATVIRTTYAYDRETFRLTHLYTRRGVDPETALSVAFTDDCENTSPPPPTVAAPDQPPAGKPCGLQNLHYTYDPAGNITHIQDNAQQTIYFRNQCIEPSNDYTYDALYRLIQASGREHLGQTGGVPIPHSHDDASRVGLLHPGDGNAMGTYTELYVYDAVGNFLQMQHRGDDPAHSGWTLNYEYDEASLIEAGKQSNRLSSALLNSDQPSSVPQFAYDAHGNMTRMPHLPLMRWDYRDQLQATARQMVNNGGTPETTWYVYDAAGQRTRKVTEDYASDGETPRRKEERIYLGGFEIYRKYESDGGTVESERESLHIMDDKQRIALVEARSLDTAGNDQAPRQLIRYQFGNHLGSASLELDELAQIISYEEYSPYGSSTYQAVRSQTETTKRYRYTGKEWENETGMYNFGIRQFAHWLGRWTSCDRAGLIDGTDLYSFGANNPVNFIDAKGTDIRYFQILFLGAEPSDQELDEYNRNPTAHNYAFISAGVGGAALAAAAGLAAAPAAALVLRSAAAQAGTAARTLAVGAKAPTLAAGLAIAATEGETLIDVGNVVVASTDVAMGGGPAAAVGLASALTDMATGPSPLGDINTARVLTEKKQGTGSSPSNSLPSSNPASRPSSSPSSPKGKKPKNSRKGGGKSGKGNPKGRTPLQNFESADELVRFAKDAGLPLGGRYGDLKAAWSKFAASNNVNLQDLNIEIHHVPSKGSTTTLHEDDFPAIVMTKADHYLTDSRGRSGVVAAETDIESFELKFERGMGEAVAKFGSAYREGLLQAFEYYTKQSWPSL